MGDRKYFGTDGIRGRVGHPPITPDFVLRLGWAAGRVLGGEHGGRVVIGKDTRISGYMFESALEAGLSAAGLDTHLLGPIPTPAIAYLTRTLRARAGIVISASHNPFDDNGIKFFSAEGVKLPDATEEAIEELLEEPLTTRNSASLGKAYRVPDAAGRYIEFCKGTVPNGLTLEGLHIVVDCAHGATYQVAPAVFSELGARVTAIGVDPDGLNINEGVGSTRPEALQDAVRRERADLGVAFDGDGDRVIMVDAGGEVVDGDELLYIIAAHRHGNGGFPGGVAGTLMSNLGLELALQGLGIPFRRAKVGDRYVSELLAAEDWLLGGETSGHIICRDRNTSGDGIIAALQVLTALVERGETLESFRQGMTKLPQTLVNVRVERMIDVHASPAITEAVESAEADLADCGRVLLRPSGTEPVVRVMVEGEDEQQVRELAERLAHVVREEAAGGVEN
ncbi:phosphoglucosamine mutase [Thiohalospira halophila DSM 15071]|uniref:Phosphoglucosamine mutase n=1 Tax=Thiohalospira halophila DSM 15071 TaxID=1123397 RepID=A0A1I1VS38_9GAMM|nr:phosphoglucosamine mutase [Thiohalospira halophila]SFD85665.1 phosphoglucosamine mutase [Thiohalospira halophila DSM 15071]